MNKLLINEPPLIIIPLLAVKFGLNEAIFLQQLHYWLERSQYEKYGQKWIYKSLENWQKEFLFWSERTIQRVISALKKQEIISIKKIEKNRNYYTINYAKLDANMSLEGRQPVTSNTTTWREQHDNLSSPLIYNENQREYTETTTESKKINKKISWEEMGEDRKTAIREEIKKIEAKELLLEDFENALLAKGYKYINFLSAYKQWVNKAKKDCNPKQDLLRNIPTEFKISENW